MLTVDDGVDIPIATFPLPLPLPPPPPPPPTATCQLLPDYFYICLTPVRSPSRKGPPYTRSFPEGGKVASHLLLDILSSASEPHTLHEKQFTRFYTGSEALGASLAVACCLWLRCGANSIPALAHLNLTWSSALTSPPR